MLEASSGEEDAVDDFVSSTSSTGNQEGRASLLRSDLHENSEDGDSSGDPNEGASNAYEIQGIKNDGNSSSISSNINNKTNDIDNSSNRISEDDDSQAKERGGLRIAAPPTVDELLAEDPEELDGLRTRGDDSSDPEASAQDLEALLAEEEQEADEHLLSGTQQLVTANASAAISNEPDQQFVNDEQTSDGQLQTKKPQEGEVAQPPRASVGNQVTSDSESQRQRVMRRQSSEASHRIKRLTSYTNVGNREISAPLHEIRAKFRARSNANFASASAGDTNVQVAQVVSLDVMDNISASLERNAQFEQHGPGLPTSITVFETGIIVGTSRSLVLVFDDEQRCTRILCKGRAFDKVDTALKFSLSSDSNFGPVSSMDAAASGVNGHNLLAIGYARGRVEIWDLTRFSLLRHLSDGPNAHTCAVCSLRFVGVGGSQSSRFDLGAGPAAPRKPYATLVSADTSGVVNMLILSKTLVIFSLESKCLLDGGAGQVVATAAIELLNLVALATRRDTFIVSLDNNTAKITHRWPMNKTSPPEGLLPRLSWGNARLADDFARQKSPHILARAEGNTIHFLRCDVALNRKTRKRQQRNDLSREIYTDSSAENIVALEWLSETLLAFLTGDYDLCILDVSGMAVVERTSVQNVELVWTAFSTKDFSFQNSVRASGSTLYLLGIRQLSIARVQSWVQRVETLIAHNGWLEALALALDHYQLTGHREKRDLVDLVTRFVTTAAGTSMLDDSRSVAACIEYCVEIEKTDYLFDTVYDVFVQCGQQSTFLRLMEPYILNRLLTVVRPSVLQDFVQEYLNHNQAERLEQCILHLTPDTIRTDLHTLVNVCKTNGLLSGLVYLYNAGLNDYETPAKTLLEMGEMEKLLSYMETSFHGLTYPFGFPMETGDDGGAAFVRVTLLTFLIENLKPMARALVLEANDVSDLFALCRVGLGVHQDEWEMRVIDAVRSLDLSEAVSLCYSRLLEHHVPGLRDPELVDQILQRGIHEVSDQSEMVELLKNCDGDLYDVEQLTEQLRAFEWNDALSTLHSKALEAAISDGQDLNRIKSVYEQIISVSAKPAAFVHDQLVQHSDSIIVREALEAAVKENLASLLKVDDERDLAAQVIVRLVSNAEDLEAFPELQFLHMKNSYLNSSLGHDPSQSSSYGFNDEHSIVRFVELLCQFEPRGVLRFMRDNDGLYPLDLVLDICKAYNVRDAAAFLLERIGDTTAALLTILSSFEDYSVLESLERTRAVSLAAIQLCERNSLADLDAENAERLWFALLDAVAKLPEETPAQASNNTAVLRQVLDAMMTRVESNTILSNIKADSFGQIRHTVKCMVDARVYEKQILLTARRLASNDLVDLVRAKHGTLAKASTRIFTQKVLTTVSRQRQQPGVWSASSSARAMQPSWDEQISDLLPTRLKIDP